MVSQETLSMLHEKYQVLAPFMDERVLRRWAASEAHALGWGGASAVTKATGISRTTIRSGIAELHQSTPDPPPGRIRKPGAGRPRLTECNPRRLDDLHALLEPATRGDPEAPLLWISKSTRNLADELVELGHEVSHDTVGRLLEEIGYSLQANRKTLEGKDHPDRDAQFESINQQVCAFQKARPPVISVDAKKEELIGDFRNPGREWRRRGAPEEVRAKDFPDKQLGKASPEGVDDLGRNEGWVSVGIDHDTAEFAAARIRRWWEEMGSPVDPRAHRLLITADAGGSNGSRSRLWKVVLPELADDLSLRIPVCHFPPGTSQWNQIEHRMFSSITKNWRGRPLVSRGVIVNLIGHVRTGSGLRIKAELDTHSYPKGIKVSDEELASERLQRAKFHGDWNYTILPGNTTPNWPTHFASVP
jgi:transposase